MFTSSRPAETHALAQRLAADARAGEVWALVGDLGAGKTHFVQGIAAGLGAPGPVTSPTFTLVHEYPADACRCITSIFTVSAPPTNSSPSAGRNTRAATA